MAASFKSYALYVRAAIVMTLGLALGLAATVYALDLGYGFDAVEVGPWKAWPGVGGMEIDPYARAVVARSGETPLGKEQGLAFVAARDSLGEKLDGRCRYRVLAPTPPARFWTLGLSTPAGGLIANPSGRYEYSSADILRREGGGFVMEISRTVEPGNWLSSGDAGPFILILRLYDTGFAPDTQPDPATFPRIVKLKCA